MSSETCPKCGGSHYWRAGSPCPETMSDPNGDIMVNAPSHYLSGGLEAISVIEAFALNFRLGNTVKYILRAGKKGDRLLDLKKAKWYLEREIAQGAPQGYS